MPKKPTEQVPQPLLETIKNRIIPLWQQGGMERCIVAPQDLKNPKKLQQWVDTGATISRSPIKGRRVAVKGPRYVENRSPLLARWPKDKLEARRTNAFALVINGQMDFQIADHVIQANAGHSMILLSGTPRPDKSTPHLKGDNLRNGHCDLFWIEGDRASGVGCWICHSVGERHFERSGESCYILDPAVHILFDVFLSEISNQRSGIRDVCNPLFEALIAAICRGIREANIFQFNYQKQDLSEETNINRIHDMIPAVKKYIENHFHQPLLIDDVARHFYLSRSEFTQRFKQETGETFHEYLTKIRLEEAQQLLTNTSWAIDKVAETAGFTTSRLRAVFNQHFGMSPMKFRKLRQKQL